MENNNLIIKEAFELVFEDTSLTQEKCEIIISELGETPSLYDIVTTLYKYKLYKGLDYIYEKYNDTLCTDYYMESIFLFLAKLGCEDGIEYFYTKNKSAIENRESFDRFSDCKYAENINSEYECSDRFFEPIFNEGLKALCTKKKVHLLKKVYAYGFKPSLSQLKVATRTLNEDIFYTVFDKLNSEVIADYIPMLVEGLCYYSKLEPIRFLFEKIGADYITEESLSKSLINSVSGSANQPKLSIFEYILNLGANIKYDNYKVFEKIFGYGHIDILDLLYKNHNDFENDKDYDLRKYIELSVKYNKAELIKYLIDNNKYINKEYNLAEDKELVDRYCSELNKYKEVLMCLIKELYKNDVEFINELKNKYPRQRKLQEFISSLNV